MGNSVSRLLQPKPSLTEAEVRRGLRMMTMEGMASAAMFSVITSGLLAAFALALGASNFQIGVLAAIPSITQILQIPAIALVERLRWRKAISVLSWFPAQAFWVLIALVPFIVVAPSQSAVYLLLGFLSLRGVLAAVTNCAWNSWVRDLVPQRVMGSYFSRRMAYSTAAAIIFGLASALFVDVWQGWASPDMEVMGYTGILVLGALTLGLASPFFMSKMPEPLMPPVQGKQPSLLEMLTMPVRDPNFRKLMNFLLSWGFAANLALPFFTIYMLQRLGLPLTAVIALNTLSQVASVLFARVWGPFADRFGSKSVLSISASLYLLVIIGWTFTTMPERHALSVPLVVVLQFFAGIAAAGVNLTVGTIGLKLAPRGQATAYMAGASLASNVGAGLGPLVGGLLADFFSERTLRITFDWIDPKREFAFSAVHLTGFDFLFAIAFLLGLITLNTLTTIREEGAASREALLDELMAPTRQMTRALAVIPGVRMLGEFPYTYLRRIPGVDVALGVTAYQVATSVQTAVSAANRGTETAGEIAGRVGSVVSDLAEQAGFIGEAGFELALHAARGTMMAADKVATSAGILAQGAVLGVLRGLSLSSADSKSAVTGAAYGTVQGAREGGLDIKEAAVRAVEAARQAAFEMGLPEETAARDAEQGALDAAESLGPEARAEVAEALGREKAEREA
jgi:MFS family permease